MCMQDIDVIEHAIAYIEAHLDGKIELDEVAEAVHYSKYHLHRMFTEMTGMTIHDYALRRQMTEAAKFLVFSERAILDISLDCGYESQQAFTAAFKAMYKLPPAKFRELREFYPLQLRFRLEKDLKDREFTKADIRFAGEEDISCWMELVRLAIDGYPHLREDDYIQNLRGYIERKQALILKVNDVAAGVAAFSYETGSIEFLGIHPQYRKRNLAKIFLDRLMEEILPGVDMSVTTYRAGDRADTGYRKRFKELGFAERELLTEFGYPTQRFVLSFDKGEDGDGTERK